MCVRHESTGMIYTRRKKSATYDGWAIENNDLGKRVAAIRSSQTGTLEEKKIRNEQIPADQQSGEAGK